MTTECVEVLMDKQMLRKGSEALLLALRVNQGTFWPCGHHRTPLTTHRVGAVAECRSCRRARILSTIHRIADRQRKAEIMRVARLRAAQERVRIRKARQGIRTKPLGEVKTAVALYRPENGRYPLDALLQGVASVFGLTTSDLKSDVRKKDYVAARCVVVQILKGRNVSYPVCGRILGGRDHSTTINLFRNFEKYARADPRVIEAYHRYGDERPN